MDKKHIMIIGNYPPPYGGVPHHIERLTEYLTSKNWVCFVLSGGTSGVESNGNLTVIKPSYFHKFLSLFRRIFDRTFVKWLGKGSLKIEEPKIWRRYKMYVDAGDSVIRHNNIQLIVSYNMLTFSPVGKYLSEKYNIPHIINIFGEIYKYKSMLESKNFFKKVSHGASRFLSCSDHCGRSLKKLGIDELVNTVTYGININHFSPGPEPINIRNKLGICDSNVVLFVGRLDSEMGLDSFYRSCVFISDKLENTCFLMVGQEGNLADEYENKCNAAGSRFLLIRNASYNDLAEYYRLATIVVVPTRGDRTCSSLAAMEAMASRKPVIGFAVGGIPEIIVNNETGILVEPENVSELSDAIMFLSGNKNIREEIAEKAYQHSTKYFDENLVNVKMEHHFLDVLGIS